MSLIHTNERIRLTKYFLIIILTVTWLLLTSLLIYGIVIIRDRSDYYVNLYLIEFVVNYGVLSFVKLLALYSVLHENVLGLSAFNLLLIAEVIVNFIFKLSLPTIVLFLLSLQFVSSLVLIFEFARKTR